MVDTKKAAGANGGSKSTTDALYPPNVSDAIIQCVGGGLSVLPIEWRSKRPKMDLLPRDADARPTWGPFKQEIADTETAMRWARSDIEAFAVVCGAVSGGLLVIDFDVPRLFDAWRENVGSMVDDLPVQQTGGGGYQVFLRCPNPGGNIRLAWVPDSEAESGRTIGIETRGEGGYAVVPPSKHPTGNYYRMIAGSLEDIPHIPQDRADALLSAARELDEMPHTRQQMSGLEKQAVVEHTNFRGGGNNNDVIGQYNAIHPIEAQLERRNYTRGPGGRYIRPGGASESVSVLDGRSCHWSSNDPLNDGRVRPDMGVHDSFSIFCALDHNGDINAAVKAAAAELGIGYTPARENSETNITTGTGTPVELHFDDEGASRDSKVAVIARVGDDVIHQDRVDLVSAASRKRFADGLTKKMFQADGDDAKQQAKIVADKIENALLARSEHARNEPAAAAVSDNQPDAESLLDEMPTEVREQAQQMLENPQLLQMISDDIARLGVAGERSLAMTVYLIGVSRLLLRPLSGRIHGHTATGKSFVPEQVSKLFPPEGIIKANRMTAQALYHMPAGALSHKWVVAGERPRVESDETAEATRALREMQASGHLSKLITMKVGDQFEAVLIEQEGPIAFTESTTAATVLDEDQNRALYLASDEREEQTKRIIRGQAAGRSTSAAQIQALIARHHALQRFLAAAPNTIEIPFVHNLAILFPTTRPEARRAFPLLLGMIESVALLHRRQRGRSADGKVVATIDDYRVARFLLKGALARVFGRALSDSCKRFLTRLRKWVKDKFTSSEAYAKENFSDRQVREWLKELTHTGILSIVEQGARGKPYTYEFARVVPIDESTDVIPEDESLLPTADEVVGKAP